MRRPEPHLDGDERRRSATRRRPARPRDRNLRACFCHRSKSPASAASAPAPPSLHPGPGLTLVVGRNGSGKSSFAEALEFLLTDRNFRWEKPRSKVWLEGWRNLHNGDACSLKTELVVEGQGPLAVTRTWNGAGITDAETRVTAPGKPARTFESLQWKDALETFRPFLSYNELGSLLEDGPSKLYDALSNVLGLDELVEVQSALVSARRTREQQRDEAKAGAKVILEQLAALPTDDDGRFVEAAAALRGTDWDFDALGAWWPVAESLGIQASVCSLESAASCRPTSMPSQRWSSACARRRPHVARSQAATPNGRVSGRICLPRRLAFTSRTMVQTARSAARRTSCLPHGARRQRPRSRRCEPRHASPRRRLPPSAPPFGTRRDWRLRHLHS